MIHNPARVEIIKKQTAAYRERISKLEERIKDTGLREQLTRARHHVDDVDHFFIGQLGKETRTPLQEANWLGYSSMALVLAEMYLSPVESAVTIYGDNAQTIG